MSVLSMILMSAGTLFLLIAAIGVIRLRDPLQRMHSATKAGTLGAALLLVGTTMSGAFDAGTGLWTILFLLLTLPIGAQLLGRAGYLSGTRVEGIEDDPLSEVLDREPEESDRFR